MDTVLHTYLEVLDTTDVLTILLALCDQKQWKRWLADYVPLEGPEKEHNSHLKRYSRYHPGIQKSLV